MVEREWNEAWSSKFGSELFALDQAAGRGEVPASAVWGCYCGWADSLRIWAKQGHIGDDNFDDVADRLTYYADRYFQNPDGSPGSSNDQVVGFLKVLREAIESTHTNGVHHPIVSRGKELKLISIDDVPIKPIDWMWRGHFARGMQHILTGEPGLGKSQVQCHLAACASTGMPWPDGSPGCQPCNVLMLTAEDNLQQIVKPRLIAANADLKRIIMLTTVIRSDKQGRCFLLSEDIDLLRIAIQQYKIGMVTIDPITAYMGGKTDQHKAGDVRNQLTPLKELAEEMHVVISTLTHPAKGAGQRAIDQFIGSQAFIAVARVGHVVVEEKGEDGVPTGRRLFANAKNNIFGKMPTLAFRLEQMVIGQTDDRTDILGSHPVWDSAPVVMSADQALQQANGTTETRGRPPNQRKVAEEFLKDILRDGPVPVNEIKEASKEANEGEGLCWRTVNAAKTKLNIKATKTGLRGGWIWELPKAQVLHLVINKENDEPNGLDD